MHFTYVYNVMRTPAEAQLAWLLGLDNPSHAHYHGLCTRK